MRHRLELVSLCAALAILTPARVFGSNSTAADVAAIESRVPLRRLMKEHGLPGMSVAVVRGFRIEWARGYGVTEKDGAEPVTPRTLFLAGSISKPVTALGALTLVAAGKLALDADVIGELKSWHVPRDGHAPWRISLAQLLDHTAGFTGGEFFPGYAVGESIPTLLQVLDGRPPARNPAVRVGSVPGSKWQYSGDGYLVVQQLMMDATGESFPRLMRERVFDRVGATDCTFDQPLPHDLDSRAARGTLASGAAVPGGWHVNPEMAAGGLWSTPTALATVAIAVARAARDSGGILPRRMARDMLAPHVREGVLDILGTPDDPDAMGYGFFVGERTHRFGHIGGNVGYQATLVFFSDRGDGVVIMTNSDIGLRVGNELLNAIAARYGWNYVAPPPP